MAAETKIDQQLINNAAWAACDTFRGVVDPAQYKDYILVTLFLKYISDVWKDHYETYQKQYGDDDARIRRKLERERFVLPYADLKKIVGVKGEKRILADYYSLLDRRNVDNLGELFNVVLDAIEESNKLAWGKCFTAKIKRSISVFKDMAAFLQLINLRQFYQ